MEIDNKIIGGRIAEYRRKKQLTQNQLAALIHVSDKAVSRWETGEGLPELANMMELSKVFEISLDQLVTGTNMEKSLKQNNNSKQTTFDGNSDNQVNQLNSGDQNQTVVPHQRSNKKKPLKIAAAALLSVVVLVGAGFGVSALLQNRNNENGGGDENAIVIDLNDPATPDYYKPYFITDSYNRVYYAKVKVYRKVEQKNITTVYSYGSVTKTYFQVKMEFEAFINTTVLLSQVNATYAMGNATQQKTASYFSVSNNNTTGINIGSVENNNSFIHTLSYTDQVQLNKGDKVVKYFYFETENLLTNLETIRYGNNAIVNEFNWFYAE